MMKKLLSACLLSSALLVGCGESNEVDVEGCEHLAEGPAVAVTASASTSGTLPSVGNDHKRYDITLPAGTGGNYTGSVSFAAAEATDYVFFLGADVSLTVTSSSGQAVAFEESAKSSEQCGDIKGRYVAPLEVGTYTLTFGPASQSSVSLVIEESEHDHEH
ncbi:hypothetical protein JQX13_48390 [Archangium violaceum]|uniref:hypothetical protein n=1 Tax=Archangium violaceum TaxID=83451 RepID=UPI00193BA9B4|nr:hypothetical protein [Archangium violaceum]QRK07726.1 hypothetical protein JQX13_48390 [Archangium violaceum]